jgi:hypothetical protein
MPLIKKSTQKKWTKFRLTPVAVPLIDREIVNTHVPMALKLRMSQHAPPGGVFWGKGDTFFLLLEPLPLGKHDVRLTSSVFQGPDSECNFSSDVTSNKCEIRLRKGTTSNSNRFFEIWFTCACPS